MLMRSLCLAVIFASFSVCAAKADDVIRIKEKSSCEAIADQSKQMLCKAFMVATSEDDDCDAIPDNSAKLICNAVSEASDEDTGHHTKSMQYCDKITSNDDRALCYSSINLVIDAASD